MSALRDLLIVCGFLAAGLGWGVWILRILDLRASGRLRHALLAAGLGLGVLGYVPFALGLAGLLRFPVLLAGYLAVLGMGAVGCISFLRHLGEASGEADGWATLRRPSGPSLALVALLVAIVSVTLLAALAPVVGVDELIYRVAAADTYLREGQMLYLPSSQYHQQPQQVQMLQMWGMALGSDSVTQVVQWVMGLLLLIAVVDLARRFMPMVWALLAGAMFYAVSDVIVLSGRASPDLANGLFLGLAGIAWLEWTARGEDRWLLVTGGLAGLFAVGARLPGAYGAIGLAVLVSVAAWRLLRRRPLRALAAGAAVGAVALAVAAPWYVKTWIQTGSPVWPFLQSVFGFRDWTPEAFRYFGGIQERAIGRWLSLGRILAAPWEFTIEPDRFNSGVVGPLLLGGLPLALVFRLPTQLVRVLAFCGILAPLWYASYPRVRAFLGPIALLFVVVAFLLWQLAESTLVPRLAALGVAGLAVAWLAVGLGQTVRAHTEAAKTTLGIESRQQYLIDRLSQADMQFDWLGDYWALNSVLPKGSRLLIYESRGYYLDFGYDRYDLIAKRETDPERLREPAYVEDQVRGLGSDYVLLWPEPRFATGYEPSNWLEVTLHDLCGSRWPIVYQSQTMVACKVAA